jgi:hypothetical protein
MPEHPDGWSCIFFRDEANLNNSIFICNRLNNPSETKNFRMDDPEFKNAHCMDLKSFQDYSMYVYRLKTELISCGLGQ